MAKKENGIAIYSRKSKFTGKGESISNQIELCRAYIRSNFGTEYADRSVVFEDEGFSGGNLKRPDFQRMLADVRKGKFRAIVVYRLDRISRNISDFAGLIEELTRLDVAFVSIREQFDTATPMGRAMMYIISVFSQLERETIAERIRDNMHELAKTGRWLGGIPPIGFCSESASTVSQDGKARKAFHLRLIPEEAEIPRLIFDLYTRTGSLSSVESELLRRRIKTRQGKDYTRFAVKAILQNPVYMTADTDAYRFFQSRRAQVCFSEEAFDGSCGIMAYNRTDQEKGKSSVILPISQWIIAPGRHPGLIPSAQWIRVQESLDRNKTGTSPRARKNEALLTGLLFCSCGSRMYPKLTRRKTHDSTDFYAYVCKRKERSKGEFCSQSNVRGNDLDALVLEQLRSIAGNEESFLLRLKKSRLCVAAEQDPREAQLIGLQEEQKENEALLSGLVDALAMAKDSAARLPILARMEELMDTGDAIRSRIQELEMPPEDLLRKDDLLEQLEQTLTHCSMNTEQLSVEEKRNAVRLLTQRIIWDGQNAHLILFGAETSDLPDTCKALFCEDSK